MKYLILCLTIILACNKTENRCLHEGDNKPFDFGICTSESNIVSWGESQATFRINNKKLVISFDQWNNVCDNFWTSIVYLPVQNGNYSISKDDGSIKPSARFNLYNGGDAVANRWDIDTTKQNWVTISSISKDSTEINGSFDLSFVLRPSLNGKFYPDLPDSLFLKNGKFNAKLRR
jgi:hypothetical protein